MNAAIRAVVRSGIEKGWEVFGVEHGFAGLIAGKLNPLGPRDVGSIVQRGGTVLGRAVPRVGVASMIDNDLYGSDVTVGVDTALNVALEAIDRLKVTASLHQRAMLVEVMGRGSGYVPLMARIAGGAVVKGEVVATPLDELVSGKKPLDPRLMEVARVLAR